MPKKIDISGIKFGRLVAIRENGKSSDRREMWLCKCECGNATTVRRRSLVSSLTKSCGCLSVIDLKGNVYGKLKVTSASKKRGKNAYWECCCECGKNVSVRGGSLRGGITKSCGCSNIGFEPTHGLTQHELFSVWSNMVARCHNEKNKKYKSYGERGVKVCDRWLIVENFISDMPPRPTPKHQIDRIDNNLGYFKDNCRWVTGVTNMRNCRNSKFWIINGVKYESVGHAEASTGINRASIHKRCLAGKEGYSCEAKYP